MLRDGAFELCVTDMHLRGADGLAVLRQARACRPPVATIVLSEQGTVADAVEALRVGAADVIAKPFHISVARAGDGAPAGQPRGRPRPGGARQTPGVAVIGDHPAMKQVLERVEQVAGTEASVLIRGETGTGKEVVARAHPRREPPPRRRPSSRSTARPSPRRSPSPSSSATCAARSPAPTSRAPGRFDAGQRRHAVPRRDRRHAARRCRPSCCACSQEREVTPVGALGEHPRSTCASSPPPTATSRRWSQDGTFREDLFYRLDVIPIEIPPLRERRQDIPALAEHFRRRGQRARRAASVPGFALDVMQRLGAYDWPGNVRELENLIERLVVVAGGPHGDDGRPARARCAPASSISRSGDAGACRRRGVDLRTSASRSSRSG